MSTYETEGNITLDSNDPTSALLTPIKGQASNVDLAHTQVAEKTAPKTPYDKRINGNNKERQRREEKKKTMQSTIDNLLTVISSSLEEEKVFNQMLLQNFNRSSQEEDIREIKAQLKEMMESINLLSSLFNKQQ